MTGVMFGLRPARPGPLTLSIAYILYYGYVMDLRHAVSSNDQTIMVTAPNVSFSLVFNLFMSALDTYIHFEGDCCSDNTSVVSLQTPKYWKIRFWGYTKMV